MKRVLIIDERFPSTGGSRTEKFVKFLPRFGWEPIILTIDQKGRNPFAEEILRNYTDPRLKIYGTKTLPNFSLLKNYNLERFGGILDRFFLVPDVTVGWLPCALIKGFKIIQMENPQIIYSTSPNEGVHVIAYLLKKGAGLPWVADFRDLWTLFQGRYEPLTFLHHVVNRYLEKSIYLRWSERVIANTEQNKNMIFNHFHVPPGKLEVITNGFDTDDAVEIEKSESRGNEMILGYAGGFEKKMVCYKEFLAGYEKAVESEKGLSLHLWATISDRLKREIERNRLVGNHITFNQYISHQKSMRALGMVDVLVVLLDSSQHHIVPQKLYNYLALNKPILAVVSPDGCAANVVRETNTGIVVSPDNIDDVANRLLQLHKQWQKGLLRFEAKDASLQKYRRDQLTKKLAGIFEKLTLKQNAVLTA